jgi:hypothetical protein
VPGQAGKACGLKWFSSIHRFYNHNEKTTHYRLLEARFAPKS